MPIFRGGYPLCLLTIVAGTAAPAGTNAITWSAADEDPSSQWDGTTGIVADRDGLYQISWGVGRGSVASTSVLAGFARVNGANVSAQSINTSTVTNQVSGCRVVRLVAGDVVELFALLHGSLTPAYQQFVTYLEVVRIGPVRWT